MTETIPCLTPDQVDRYFEHIQLPHVYRRDRNPRLDIALLTAIHTYHVSTIPYENIALHYAPSAHISLGVTDIYHKFVERGRGGYCMENNIFLHHILSLLGFQVYLAGARLYRDSRSSSPGWSGWEHAVNIVTLADQSRYLVDVGYGGDGPTTPLPLAAGPITTNIGTQELQLGYDTIDGLTDAKQRLWIYRFRNAPDGPWTPAYAFPETEFLHRDFEVMSYYTSQHPRCFLTSNLLVIKFLRDGSNIYGKTILDQDKVKENLGGKSVLVEICRTEEDRVRVLQERFGICLTKEEQDGIIGRKSELVR
ncbi:arylamine N-acetyltransferase family protein, partial [Aspergillus fijiensis CBS 313.89]